MTAPNLDKREQAGMIFGGLGVVCVLFMLAFIPLGPMKNFRESQAQILQAENDLQLARSLKIDEEVRLQSQEAFMQRLKARPANFDFVSFVSQTLRDSDLMGRAQVENYRTRQSSAVQPMVQCQLQGIRLEELVDLLHRVYASENLVAVFKVDRLEPSPTGKGLDCDLTFVTVKV